MSVELLDQLSSNESEDGRTVAIRVVVFGSSLFLTAVTAVLQEHAAIDLIHLPDVASPACILKQKPKIILWQRHCPLENIAALLEAGLWLLEIDEQQNAITIQHHSQRNKRTQPIQKSTDLIAWITQPAEM